MGQADSNSLLSCNRAGESEGRAEERKNKSLITAKFSFRSLISNSKINYLKFKKINII